MQLVDFGAWLMLLRQRDAVKSVERVEIKGTRTLALAGFFLVFLQPIACAASPVVVAFEADVPWKWSVLGVSIFVSVASIVYAVSFYATSLKHQRVFYGSLHSGLFHEWLDAPHGTVGRVLKPTYVYGALQLVSSSLQFVVCFLVLLKHTRTFVVVFSTSTLFWVTFFASIGWVGELVSSRISSVWCWVVSLGLVVAAILTLWDSWLVHPIHLASAAFCTLVSYLIARTHERGLLHKSPPPSPPPQSTSATEMPLLNFAN
jgi:hypothetical protein